MTIGGLKSKISGKYNLQDENDIIIQFNGVQYDSKREDAIIRRKHKHVQKAAASTENNQALACGGHSNKVSRTPSPQGRKFRQTGTRTGTKGSAVIQPADAGSSHNVFARHNRNVK